MDTENKNAWLDEEVDVVQEESKPELANDQEFKDLVYERMRKIHNEGMIVGFQTACHTALDKIYTFEKSAGKKSTNDYKRCIKDLKKFFEIGISRKSNSVDTVDAEEDNKSATEQN
jgi:hypothetical protein